LIKRIPSPVIVEWDKSRNLRSGDGLHVRRGDPKLTGAEQASLTTAARKHLELTPTHLGITSCIMPVSNRRQRPVKVAISPLLHSSTSADKSMSSSENFGYASSRLWDRLSMSLGTPSGHEADVIGVAIVWPEETRLRGKRKRKSIVIWVQRADVSRERMLRYCLMNCRSRHRRPHRNTSCPYQGS